MSNQSPDERLESLNKRLDLNAYDVPARMERAQLSLARHDLETALHDVRRCLQIAVPEPRLQGETRAMLLCRLYTLESRVLGEMAAWDEAFAGAEHALEMRPNDPVALAQRGRVRVGLGDHPGALQDLSAALQMNPRLAEAYLARAVLYHSQDDYLRARADDDRALGADPTLAAAWGHRARVQLALKNYDNVESDGRRALHLDPLLTGTYLDLADCALAREQPDEAVRVLLSGLERLPASADLLVALAHLYAEQNRLDEALAALDRLLEGSPRHGVGLAMRGQVHARRGDTRAALADLESALEIRPDAQTYLDSARQYGAAGCRAAALNAAERALALDAENAEARAVRDQLRGEFGELGDDPLVAAAGALEQFAFVQCGPGRVPVAGPVTTGLLRLGFFNRKPAEEVHWRVEIKPLRALFDAQEKTLYGACLDLCQVPAALVAVTILPGEYGVFLLREQAAEGQPALACALTRSVPAAPDALRELLYDFLSDGTLQATGTQLRCPST